MVDTCHYTFVKITQCATLSVNPNVNGGLGVIVTCPCRLRTVTTVPLGDAGNVGGERSCLRSARGTWQISTLSSQFSFALPKTALKMQFFHLKSSRFLFHILIISQWYFFKKGKEYFISKETTMVMGGNLPLPNAHSD